jgi:steroid 5-alpha reductase family enzyme
MWVIQGLWVVVTAGAALAAITSGSKTSFGALGVLGLVIWIIGFAIEAVSDAQKATFKNDVSNDGKFIDVGLWRWSRHPNYFGEITLWVGMAVLALPALNGWQHLTLISPIFVIVLLTRVSGLPMLEQRSDKKWGGQPDYETYKASTPILIPRPPR